MSSLVKAAKGNYSLYILGAAVSGGLIAGAFMCGHILKNDPTILLTNKKVSAILYKLLKLMLIHITLLLLFACIIMPYFSKIYINAILSYFIF